MNMIYRTFYLLFAATLVYCNDQYNGKVFCFPDGTSYGSGTDSHCTQTHPSVRLEKYGIDCCNTGVTNNMKEFHAQFENLNQTLYRLLDETTKSTLRMTCTSQVANDTALDGVINTMYTNFSSTCQRYTDVMALKHQLQCHVFSGTPDMAAQLTPLIISLQTAAVKLQRIEKENYNFKGGRSCLEFSAKQYHQIYESNFEEDVLSSFENRIKILRDTTDVCCNWNRYQKRISPNNAQ